MRYSILSLSLALSILAANGNAYAQDCGKGSAERRLRCLEEKTDYYRKRTVTLRGSAVRGRDVGTRATVRGEAAAASCDIVKKFFIPGVQRGATSQTWLAGSVTYHGSPGAVIVFWKALGGSTFCQFRIPASGDGVKTFRSKFCTFDLDGAADRVVVEIQSEDGDQCKIDEASLELKMNNLEAIEPE